VKHPDPNDFESDEVELEDRLETRAEFSETLAQNGFPDTLVLSRERASSVFHKRHLEVLDYLEENGPVSISEISEELEYSEGCIDTYILNFLKIDIVEFNEDEPRLKHNHVVIEPIV